MKLNRHEHKSYLCIHICPRHEVLHSTCCSPRTERHLRMLLIAIMSVYFQNTGFRLVLYQTTKLKTGPNS